MMNTVITLRLLLGTKWTLTQAQKLQPTQTTGSVEIKSAASPRHIWWGFGSGWMVSFLFPRYDWLQSLQKSIVWPWLGTEIGRGRSTRTFLEASQMPAPAFPGAQDLLQGLNRAALKLSVPFIALYILMSESQKHQHSAGIPPWAWCEV